MHFWNCQKLVWIQRRWSNQSHYWGRFEIHWDQRFVSIIFAFNFHVKCFCLHFTFVLILCVLLSRSSQENCETIKADMRRIFAVHWGQTWQLLFLLLFFRRRPCLWCDYFWRGFERHQCRDELPATSLCRQNISYSGPFPSYSFRSVRRKTWAANFILVWF